MGVPTSEVGYTLAMPRREDHEVHKDMWWHWTKKKIKIRHLNEHETLSQSNSIKALKRDQARQKKMDRSYTLKHDPNYTYCCVVDTH